MLFKVYSKFFLDLKKAGSRSIFSKLEINEEVDHAVKTGRAIVAFESAIITHGMPHPFNYNTSLEVERIARSEGVVPATIGIINGKIKIGLSEKELEFLSDKSQKLFKVSRRDLPKCISQKESGGTTVSATMIAAHMAGIRFFATGGIGGVHRDYEKSLDASADLKELGRTPVAVISSGVKSILDIPRTLEYLETEGVPVVTVSKDSDFFPAFFSRSSGIKSPLHVPCPDEAAKLLETHFDLNLNTGILLAVPIPQLFSLDDIVNESIENALAEAAQRKITGREVTPFLLQRLNEATKGRSLLSNIELVKNNALVASRIAKLMQHRRWWTQEINNRGETIKSNNIVIVGGINYDISASVSKDSTLKLDGSTNQGRVEYSYGGVGRNLAEGIHKLGADSIFISCVGDDAPGRQFLETYSCLDKESIKISRNDVTAVYNVIVDGCGNPVVAVGDMHMHDNIDVEFLKEKQQRILDSKFVVLDGNLPIDSLEYLILICFENLIPIWFEPTDGRHVSKIKKVADKITYTSPNVKELIQMANNLLTDFRLNITDDDIQLNEIIEIGKKLNQIIPNIVVTMGKHGVLSIKKKLNLGSEVMHLNSVWTCDQPMRSASGAGDSLAAATVCGLVEGLSLDSALCQGLAAAHLSLRSTRAVPDDFSKTNIQKMLENPNFKITKSLVEMP